MKFVCMCCIILRYHLPGISAFNFVLKDALGGGGVASLKSDPQVHCVCFLLQNA